MLNATYYFPLSLWWAMNKFDLGCQMVVWLYRKDIIYQGVRITFFSWNSAEMVRTLIGQYGYGTVIMYLIFTAYSIFWHLNYQSMCIVDFQTKFAHAWFFLKAFKVFSYSPNMQTKWRDSSNNEGKVVFSETDLLSVINILSHWSPRAIIETSIFRGWWIRHY